MINNVVLVGRLTKDPDLRYTQNGTAVASFTLAVNRSFTNQQGEREADFISCVIWRKSAEALATYAKKGTLIGVTGRIQTRSYENQQGQRVYVTEVVCDNFQLLESKRATEERQQQSYSGMAREQETPAFSYSGNSYSQPSVNKSSGMPPSFGADNTLPPSGSQEDRSHFEPRLDASQFDTHMNSMTSNQQQDTSPPIPDFSRDSTPHISGGPVDISDDDLPF